MAQPHPVFSVQDRLLALVKTLQFFWFTGHVVLLTSSIRYGFSWLLMNYYGRVAQFSYRVSFLAAAITYGIVVYKTQRSRAKAGLRAPGGAVGAFADENVQYLLMALIWLSFPQYPIALLPYCVYSVFHVATYVRANLIPALQTPAPYTDGASPRPRVSSPLAENIGAFVKEYYDASMPIVSSLEVLLWIRVLLSAILLQRKSWILLGLYTAFLRARYTQSSHVRGTIIMTGARIDSLVNTQSAPAPVSQAWAYIKSGARQFHDATDVNKYLTSSSTPAKKTS